MLEENFFNFPAFLFIFLGKVKAPYEANLKQICSDVSFL